jgi:hypothetical protein
MKKLKTARSLMIIMLISVCGWTAIVGLVIKPPLWIGAGLSLGGGFAIGAVISFLIWRWWIRRLPPDSARH